MAASLAAIALPANLVWTDEYDWTPVAQQLTRTVSGALIVEESAITAGRPITLADDWAPRSLVESLRALAATPGQIHTLLWHGTEYQVAFRRPPFTARPVLDYAEPESGDWYVLTLNLITMT